MRLEPALTRLAAIYFGFKSGPADLSILALLEIYLRSGIFIRRVLVCL